MTKLAIASTIGTARGTTHGSCRPLAASSPAVPSYCAVACGATNRRGALEPNTNVNVLAVRDPACTPPLQFVAVPRRPSGRAMNGSLCFEPGTSVPRKLSRSRRLSWRDGEHRVCKHRFDLSKTGSPSPGGTLRRTQVIVPPMESCAAFARKMR